LQIVALKTDDQVVEAGGAVGFGVGGDLFGGAGERAPLAVPVRARRAQAVLRWSQKIGQGAKVYSAG